MDWVRIILNHFRMRKGMLNRKNKNKDREDYVEIRKIRKISKKGKGIWFEFAQ